MSKQHPTGRSLAFMLKDEEASVGKSHITALDLHKCLLLAHRARWDRQLVNKLCSDGAD